MLIHEELDEIWVSSIAIAALQFSSHRWLTVLISDMLLHWDPVETVFALNIPLHRLQGKSDLKKRGMLGIMYMVLGHGLVPSLGSPGLLVQEGNNSTQGGSIRYIQKVIFFNLWFLPPY